jgi:hypothetical protein
MHPFKNVLGILSAGIFSAFAFCDSNNMMMTGVDSGPTVDMRTSNDPNRAGASVHYYYYQGFGMLQCPGKVPGHSTQMACDDLGKSETENGTVNQVGLSCDPDPTGCIVDTKLLVTATDRCPMTAKSVKVTYKTKSLTLRIVDRTSGNGGFDLGLDPWVDLGIYNDLQIGVTGPQDILFECLP